MNLSLCSFRELFHFARACMRACVCAVGVLVSLIRTQIAFPSFAVVYQVQIVGIGRDPRIYFLTIATGKSILTTKEKRRCITIALVFCVIFCCKMHCHLIMAPSPHTSEKSLSSISISPNANPSPKCTGMFFCGTRHILL